MDGCHRECNLGTLPVTYRGQMLEVAIGLETVEYALLQGESLVIRHETEEVLLTRERPVAVRPISRR
jgi:alpha,alpha-trehalose phosphorylase